MLPTDLSAWRARLAHQALSAHEAYRIAIDSDRARGPQVEVGYRLYWLSDVLLGTLEVAAERSGYVVVGRHSSCDVVLDDELGVSLRHVLVRAAALDDGFPVLGVLDLQTGTGFELSDRSLQRSIAATGPLVFRVGTHSVVALPSTGNHPDSLPVPLVERGERVPRRIVPLRLVAVDGVAVEPQRHGPDDKGPPASCITLLPNSVDLSRRRSVPMLPMLPLSRDPQAPAPPPAEGEIYEVILESTGGRAGVRFSEADLDHGVLIGRADKCVDEGLRAVLGIPISRVHVLLIREHGSCHLYDVASLNGTFANGRPVRCLPLADHGTTVCLAGRGGVTLEWRAL